MESPLRALLCCLRRWLVRVCTSLARRSMSSRRPLRTPDCVALGETGGNNPDQYLCLSQSAHPLVTTLSRSIGRAFFLQTVPLQGQIRHQLLQLPVLFLELVHLQLGGIPHRVTGQPLLPCLHEHLVHARYEWGSIPSLRQRSLTTTSRWNPSRTTRIFSSAAHLHRVAVLTLQTKDLVSSVRSSAATAFAVSIWDISAPLSELRSLDEGANLTSKLAAISAPSGGPFSLTVYTSPPPSPLVGPAGTLPRGLSIAPSTPSTSNPWMTKGGTVFNCQVTPIYPLAWSTLAGCGRKGFRGAVRAAGMTAMSLSDAFPDGLTACGGARQRGL